MQSKQSKYSKLLKYIRRIGLVAAIVPALYVFSIIWRVSCAEQDLFGRSCLVPFSLSPRSYTESPTAESYGDGTFTFKQNGKSIRIYKQLINGFQHTYGSALAAYEIGNSPSEILFDLNEYFEAYLGKEGSTWFHFLDTKKDLANNMVGRKIGSTAREQNLSGSEANKFMIDKILNSITNKEVINHYLNPRVKTLPDPDAYGCRWLPHPQEPK